MAESRAPDEIALRYQAKRAIRDRLLAVRRALPASARAARSAQMVAQLAGHEAWQRARCIASYVPLRGEADPGPLVEEARVRGVRVALPRLTEDGAELELRLYAGGAALEESALGFQEPAADAPPVPDAEVDMVLVPAVAVDERGHRVGFGRGFYDRLLPRLTNATRVALAFEFQLLAELPDTPGDERVDVVVTDGRCVVVTDGRGK